MERTQYEFGPQAALLLALAAALLGSFLHGCCHPRPVEQASWDATPGAHLVFNPAETGWLVADTARADWPITVVYQDPGETIAYRETILDRQGWYGWDHDRPYRRFDSVRVGHTRR